MCERRREQSTRSELSQEEAGVNARSLLPWKHSSLETHGNSLCRSFRAQKTRQETDCLPLLHLLNLSVGIYCQFLNTSNGLLISAFHPLMYMLWGTRDSRNQWACEGDKSIKGQATGDQGSGSRERWPVTKRKHGNVCELCYNSEPLQS